MKILKINSKKHGTFKVLLDDADYELVTASWRTPKWCARICTNRRNLIYFQKRLPGGSLIELHRFLMGFPKGVVDHINGNTLDNRRKNLQILNNSQNISKGRIRLNNSSGTSGVHFDKSRKKWAARIKVMYKEIHLGRFKNKSDAIKARKEAEKKYWNDNILTKRQKVEE